MAVAIVTRFIGPTNYRQSRVVAETGDNNPSTGKPDRLIVNWKGSLNVEENHAAAAKSLAEKLGWDGAWIVGGMLKGNVYVRTFGACAPGDCAFIVNPTE